MENDYRTPPDQFPKDRNVPPLRPKKSGGPLIPIAVVAAFALVALFAFGGDRSSDMPYTSVETPLASDATSFSPNEIEPAEGESFTQQTPPAAMEGPTAAVVTTTPVEPMATSSNTYASEQECASSTGAPCHYVTCDSIPEGKQPDEVCGPNFTKGWQPVVPATDKTAIPEEIAPPLTGQGNAPVETPPLTGQ
jgi:hypothetical protein